MRVLLTGATGFLGTTLWRRFLQEKHEVVILKRSNSDTGLVQELLTSENFLNVDQMSLQEVFDISKPDAVVHTLCAYGRHNESVTQIVEANLMIGLRMLEQCAFNKVFFVNTATILPPRVSYYSLSKSQLMQWLEHLAGQIDSVSLQFDHLYGPGDSPLKFPVWLLDQFKSGVNRLSLTEGKQIRNFIHVQDAASLFALVLRKKNHFSGHTVIPAGSCHETRVRDFVLLLARLWEEETKKDLKTQLCFGERPYRNFESMHTVIKPVVVAGEPWKAAINLESGLRELVKWHIGSQPLSSLNDSSLTGGTDK